MGYTFSRSDARNTKRQRTQPLPAKAGRLLCGGLNRRLEDNAPERRWFSPQSAFGGLKQGWINKNSRKGSSYTSGVKDGPRVTAFINLPPI